MEVAVLERGLEWQSGEFPDGLARAFGQIRIDNSAAPQLTGNETALFDLRLGQGTGASGSALHNSRYDFNDDILPLGSALHASLIEQAMPLAAP